MIKISSERLVLLTLSAELLGSNSSGHKPMKPMNKHLNIIFILADDMGYGDFGCYNAK
jgi:hypothetical protein